MTLDQLKFQLRIVSLFNDAKESWRSKGSCGNISPEFPASAAKALLSVIKRAEFLSGSTGVVKGTARGMLEDILAEFSKSE